MKLYEKLQNAFGGFKAADVTRASQSFTLTDGNFIKKWFGSSTYTGKNVTDSSAMQVTAAFACIRLLAETMGTMPSAIFQQDKSGNAEKVDHPLSEILIHQPNSDMNGLEYREACTANLAGRGNSVSIIDRRTDGDVFSLYPVPWSKVRVKKDQSTNFETKYGIEDRGKLEWFPADKIWHRKIFSFSGLIGLSPIDQMRQAIGLALAGEEHNANMFGNGLLPSSIIKIPEWLTEDQRKQAKEKLKEANGGLKNSGNPFLLEGGMEFESLITPADAQFLELRKFTVIEICRIFNIKPHMIASLEQATNNNIEQLSQEFVQYTMLPYMRRDEMAVRKLFKPADRSKFFYRYNADSLLRADSMARAGLYSILLQNGVYSRNEVRALENRNKVEDPAMDGYTVQLNMTQIDDLAKINAAKSGG